MRRQPHKSHRGFMNDHRLEVMADRLNEEKMQRRAEAVLGISLGDKDAR